MPKEFTVAAVTVFAFFLVGSWSWRTLFRATVIHTVFIVLLMDQTLRICTNCRCSHTYIIHGGWQWHCIDTQARLHITGALIYLISAITHTTTIAAIICMCTGVLVEHIARKRARLACSILLHNASISWAYLKSNSTRSVYHLFSVQSIGITTLD